MKIYVKAGILCCLVCATSILFSMQQPRQSIFEQLQILLTHVDKNSKAIADLLWDSVGAQKQFQGMIELIHAQKQPQLEYAVAQEILKHAANIHALLFENVVSSFPVSMRWTHINDLLCLYDARYILGYVEPGKMLCWDTQKGSAKVCWQQNIPYQDCYNISSSYDSLVYRVNDALKRYSGETSTDEILMISAHESVYSELGGRFVLVGPNLEKLKDLEKSERCYKILDFEKPERKIVLPGSSYFNTITVSADNAFIIVDEERYEGQKHCIVKQLISTATGEIFNLYDQGLQPVCRCTFSPSSRYIAVGVESSNFMIFDVTQRVPRAVVTITCDEGVYSNITFLENDACLIEHISATRGRSINVLDLKTGQSIYTTSTVTQCIVAPQGKFIALAHESDIALYDVAQHRVTKNIHMPISVALCALSKNGKYLAVKEKDDEQCLSVYACESENLLLRVPTTCNKFMFYDNEAYLIGMVIDEFSKTKSICFWNVETGHYLGSWNAGRTCAVYSKDGCPQVMVNYTMAPKSFLIMRVDDIIKLDRMLSELAQIEIALKLAIVSNRNVLVEHTEHLLRFISDEYTQKQACVYGQYTASLLAALDRLVAYDACLNWLVPAQEPSSTSVTMQCPAKKRVKKEQGVCERELLEVGQKQLKFSGEKDDFLKSKSLQESLNRFLFFGEQIQKLADLPLQDQKEIMGKICPAEVFKYMVFLRNELRENSRCLYEGSWQYQALRLCLTWLPVCEKNLPNLIKEYNRNRVVGYYNNLYPVDDSMYSLVAQKIREYITCVQNGTESQIQQTKQELDVMYCKVVGNVFASDTILLLLKLDAKTLHLCRAYQQYYDLCHNHSLGFCIMPSYLQELLCNSKAFIQGIKSQIHVAPIWVFEQLEKLERIAAIGDVEKLDMQQRICLVFFPNFKKIFDSYCC